MSTVFFHRLRKCDFFRNQSDLLCSIMLFRRKFWGICKTIHFWNLGSMQNPKPMFASAQTPAKWSFWTFKMAAIKDIIYAILAFTQPGNLIQHANTILTITNRTNLISNSIFETFRPLYSPAFVRLQDKRLKSTKMLANMR